MSKLAPLEIFLNDYDNLLMLFEERIIILIYNYITF